MADYFSNFSKTLDSPADRHFSIVPDDQADLAIQPRALRANGAGDIALRDGEGNTVTYTVNAGEVLAFRPVRVLATGTTATGLVGWY